MKDATQDSVIPTEADVHDCPSFPCCDVAEFGRCFLRPCRPIDPNRGDADQP